MEPDATERLLRSFSRLTVPASESPGLHSLIAQVTDWSEFARRAEDHGLAPMVLWHNEKLGLSLPADGQLQLKALVLRQRGAAEVRHRVLGELLAEFQRRGIEVLALKGLALASILYPEHGLRPMRDMDLLYPRMQQAELREAMATCGFDLPEKHADDTMRDSNQLPDATREEGGYTVCLDLHHDAIGRDSPGHLYFEDSAPHQTFEWDGLALKTLGHTLMLRQLCRHLADRHPGSRLKLANVMDVVGYAEVYCHELDWQKLHSDEPHVINTLKCLHLLTPVSAEVANKLGIENALAIEGVGDIMPQLKDALRAEHTLGEKLRALFFPSPWWLHLHYGIPPEKPLAFTRLLRHPAAVFTMLGRRLLSRLLGG